MHTISMGLPDHVSVITQGSADCALGIPRIALTLSRGNPPDSLPRENTALKATGSIGIQDADLEDSPIFSGAGRDCHLFSDNKQMTTSISQYSY